FDAAQALARVAGEVALGLLAVVDDVEPDGDLLAHDVRDGAAHARREGGRIVRAVLVARLQHLAQRRRPGEASGVCREDPVGAVFHRGAPPAARVTYQPMRDPGIDRRRFLSGVAFAAMAGRTARAAAATSSEWEQTVAAAKKEGKVAVNTFTGQG